MADALRNALNRKLAAYEGAGMSDHAAAVKKRLGELDKPKASAKKPTAKKSSAKKSTGRKK